MELDKENLPQLANVPKLKKQRSSKGEAKGRRIGLTEITEEGDQGIKGPYTEIKEDIKPEAVPLEKRPNLEITVEEDPVNEPATEEVKKEATTGTSFRKTPSRLSISIPLKECFDYLPLPEAPKQFDRTEEVRKIRELTEQLVNLLQTKLQQIDNTEKKSEPSFLEEEQRHLKSYSHFLLGMKNIVDNSFADKFQQKIFIDNLQSLEKFSSDYQAYPGQLIYYFPKPGGENGNKDEPDTTTASNRILDRFPSLFLQSLDFHINTLLFLEISFKGWGVNDGYLKNFMGNSIGRLSLLSHFTLDLSKNNLTDISQIMVKDLLLALRSPLRSLNLYFDYNTISNAGFKTLLRIFESPDFAQNLEEIQLGYSHNTLASGCFSSLGSTMFESLRKANKIKKLLLGFSHNAISNQAIRIVSEGCASLNNLEELYLEFYNNVMDEKNFNEVISPIAMARGLKILKLDFGKNKIDHYGIEALGNIIMNLENLRSLKLYFDRCNISNHETKLWSFFNAVQSLKHLEEIKWDFSYNDISPDFLRSLEEVLQPNLAKSLSSFALSLNHCSRNTRPYSFADVKFFLEDGLKTQVLGLKNVILSIEGSDIKEKQFLIMMLTSIFKNIYKASFQF